ncbi:MAG: adenosylmethionine-8-amino-7-oxononanoate aminotransferase [Omnitrophica bacterium RIFCSPHIGHO2_02_FULL_63_14]|nr:MAG: adenosylmethionine-8-amino-7-oxononanoate aminotransferase [Omnitrophica bacterium RIFCSPHIGHO2_02_FULL_63_14]
MNEKELLAKERKYCSWGDTVHYLEPPKFFDRCEGSYLYDKRGTKYLDLQMWYSAASFGYANPRLARALKAQVDKLPQLACQYLHEEKVELAEKIARSMERIFGLKGRVHFNVGGSQAVEDSLKLVRNHTGKNFVFAFMGGYHGRTLGASAITSSYRYRRRYGHFADRAQFVPYPYCFRCPYDKKYPDCGLYCAKQFDKLFETEYNGVWDAKAGQSEYAAFYVESIQGTGGYVIPPKEYFPMIKKTLERHGILLVDDEIQMGFYRAGKLWGIEQFGVKPDILVFGKALTNGLNPLSGIWAREELINPRVFPAGSTHSTFSSNTLGTAVGLEVMRMTEEENTGAKVMKKGRAFLARLKELQKKHPGVIGDVDGMGLALRMELCKPDGRTPDRALADRIFAMGLKGGIPTSKGRMGLVLDVGGYFKNVFTLAPAFDITDGEMDLGVEMLDWLIRKCK